MTKQSTTVAILTSLAALTAAAIVFATIPDARGIIHGCYSNPGGELRVIDDATDTCRPNETAISWSQSGIVGYEVISSETVEVPPLGDVVARARCTPGKRVLGGGFHMNSVVVIQSFPQTSGPTAPSWQVLVHNDNNFMGNVSVFAVCAVATP